MNDEETGSSFKKSFNNFSKIIKMKSLSPTLYKTSKFLSCFESLKKIILTVRDIIDFHSRQGFMLTTSVYKVAVNGFKI